MVIGKIKVTGTRAETIEALDIPQGIVGTTVSFDFSEEWSGLTKNVVFVGAKDVEVLNIQDSAKLPPEVVSAPNIIVKVGIVGVDTNNKLVIPTLWADLGTVKPGAPADMGYEPTLPIWAQLLGMIGDLRSLNTVDKSNLVAAVNEAMSNSGGGTSGYYTPVVTQPTANTMQVSFVPSVATMPAVEPVTITLPGSDSGQNVTVAAVDYDKNVKAIAHRGYSTEAPENTIPAYILAKQKGFNYAECDVSFTSDGVAVLLHDGTIDRTSDGSGAVYEMTYAELLQYDFGSFKGAKYVGTKIPTFKEFIATCRGLCIHPYIEFKSDGGYTEEQIVGVVAAVKAHGMRGKVTYISFNDTYLEYVKTADPTARLGYLASDTSAATMAIVEGLRSGSNEVFMDIMLSRLTAEGVTACIAADIPVEVWTVNDATSIEEMDAYITGVTSDKLIAGKILYDKHSTYTVPDAALVPATSITLDKTELAFTDFTAQTLTATVEPPDTTDNVVWTSSNNAVATVSGGVVTPVANGTCKVVATAGSVSVSCDITVDVANVNPDTPNPDTPSGGTLLYNWDFTQSLTDTVSGVTAKLVNESYGNVDADGVHFTGGGGQISFTPGISLTANTLVEMDVSSADFKSTGHGRFIMWSNDSGFIYRSTGSWQIYNGSWSGDTVETNSAAIAGKTVALAIGADMTATAYIDGVPVASATAPDNGVLSIGSGISGYFDVTITGLRVYSTE